MAVGRNERVIQFNGGNVLSSSWPYGIDGQTGAVLSQFAMWSGPHAGNRLFSSPFSLSVILPPGRPAQLAAEALRFEIPHNEDAALWRDHAPGTRGELSLHAAYLALEAILSNGSTVGPNPSEGRGYLALHRTETRSTALAAELAVDSTTLNIAPGLSAEIGEFLRITANPGGTNEIVRVTEKTSDAEYTIARGQPDFNGADTEPATHAAGNAVTLLEGPDLDNELVNAGAEFPASPAFGQRFVFSAANAAITGAADENGDAVTSADADDSFIHNGTSWVRESQATGVLRNFGAVGYSRVEIVRSPLMVAGSPAAYTDAESFESNRTGWVFSPL